MKKTKLTRSLLAACSIVALSAVMYGCTHSSGPSQTDLDAANEATAAATAEAKANADAAAVAAADAKAAADAAAADAATAAADAKAAADEAAADAATAAADAAAAAADLATAAAAEAAAAAAAALDLAKAAADEAAAAAAADLAKAEEDRLAAEKTARELQAAADKVAAGAASDDAKALLNMALRDIVDADGAAGIQVGETDPFVTILSPPDVELSVSDDGMLLAGAKVEATATTNAIVYTMADMAADTIEGWRGAMLTEVGGNNTAVVYSDIELDETASLLDRYVSNLPTATSPRSWDIDEDDTDDDDEAATTVNDDKDISWSDVRRPDEMTTAGGTSANPITMFTGRVHGIPGTFSCDAPAAALCVAPETYTDGKVNGGTTGLADTENWMFTPDEGAISYTDDMEYLVFGWWLDKGEDDKPDYVHPITIAPGWGDGRILASTSGENLRGDATYKGAAAGKYAMASAGEDMYEGGHFTAMATLMVDFDADLDATNDTDDNDGVALSGTINNFMTGDKARPDWSVALMVDGYSGTADVTEPLTSLAGDPDAEMTTEWSTGGAQSGTGTWAATFYGGDNTADNEEFNSENNTAPPMAVTGTFNAHIGTDDADTGAIGRLQGAFGANKE